MARIILNIYQQVWKGINLLRTTCVHTAALINAKWLILMGTRAGVYFWNRMKQEWARLAKSVRPIALDWAAQLIHVYMLCPMGFWAISIASHFESGSCHNLTAGAPRWHQLWISMSLEDPPSLTMLAKDTELHTTQPMSCVHALHSDINAHYSDITNSLVSIQAKPNWKQFQHIF